MPLTDPSTAVPGPAAPSSIGRLTVARWVGIYPTITALLLLLGPVLLGHLPTPLISLLLTALLVPITQYVVFPLIERLSAGRVRFPVLNGPARHRTALVVWAVTYPLITLVLLVILPLLAGHVPIPVLTLVVTLIAVPVQSLVLLPRILPLARPWIQASTVRNGA
ncbi:hypothetical protein [Deinococcus sp.]|uniref:hypothetical protein n=1 Tax=Deinococcus sp. TaxID=47478 RepID=UPI0025B80BA5|nr:hypothetical protein [Deinococcus sp.]